MKNNIGLEGGLDDRVQVIGNEVSVKDDLADKSVMKLNCVIEGEVRSENKGDGYGNDFMVREDNRHGYNDDNKSDEKTKLMATEIRREIEIVELHDTEEIVCVSEKISSMDYDGIFWVDSDNTRRSIMEERVVEYKRLTRREKQLNRLYDPEIPSDVLCMVYGTEVVDKSYSGVYPISENYMLPNFIIRKYIFRTEMEKRPEHFRFDIASNIETWKKWVDEEVVYVYDNLKIVSVALGTAILDTLKALDMALEDEMKKKVKNMGRSFDGFIVMETRSYHSQFLDNGRGIDVIKVMQAAYTNSDTGDHAQSMTRVNVLLCKSLCPTTT
ncbi:hypothetical protein TorRG33x02_170760 [Trema orientale]|uniref:Uncharacterized protein n=1 Tax=Trema orientale TaxID=63057 RepID=A0A2P5ENK2_TREOI|nr:hypothetical protein TorRG33x02_170760 [Trema orientale]